MLKPIKQEESSFTWLHRIIDLVIPTISLYLITILYQINWQERYQVMAILGGLTLVLTAQFIGIYTSWRGRPFFTSIKLITIAWAITWAILIITAFLIKDGHNFSRLAVAIWAISTPIFLISYRLAIRLILINYRKHGGNLRTVGIIGAGKTGQHIASVINKNQWMGYKVTAFFDDEKPQNTTVNNIKIIGNTDNIAQVINIQKINEIYICLPLKAEDKIKRVLNELTDTTAIVKFVPNLFTFDLMHAKWTELKGVPVVSVFDTPLNSLTSRVIKRTEDLVISIAILTVISPLLLWVAIKVKLSSHGPVIFKQKRYGINGKEIQVYKFRSMTTQDNGKNIVQAKKNDARVTSFGAFIRKTSLDELPQFINVIQGTMSIVGPRPHAIAHNEEYRSLVPKYMQRHIVKPGITGWAQINGWRGETDTIDKMQNRIDFDLHYITNWSLWLDIKIIILTTFKGFINKNAY